MNQTNTTIVKLTIPEQGEPDYTQLLEALTKPEAKIESTASAGSTIFYVVKSK